MASSDIYQVKDPQWAKKAETPSRQGRRHRRSKTFDEAVNPDLPHTHRRRSHNSGFRRFRHLMKNPSFNKKFWIITLGTSALILASLIVWDVFFRYPKTNLNPESQIYRAVVE